MNSSAILASEQGFTRRRLLQLAAVSGAVGIIGYLGVRPRGRLKPVRHSQPMMGTIVNLVVCGEDEGSCRQGIEACIERMETLSMMMSTYVSDSPLSELNRFGSLNDAPQELVEVFKLAIELSELTDGAFDPTVLPLVGLFKEVRKTGKLPDQQKVKEILQVVDYRHIVVEDDTTVKYSTPGVTATLDAVAKGYIVDRGIEVLQRLGFGNAFIEAGGDLMVVGYRYDGKPWKIGIRNPRSDDLKKMTTIEMSDRAIATSGDYMQYSSYHRSPHRLLSRPHRFKFHNRPHCCLGRRSRHCRHGPRS